MGVLSGIGGVVDGADTIRTWTAEISDELIALYASNTQGGPHRLGGNEDWSASYNCYGGLPTRLPGETIGTLKLSLDESVGISGPAMVERVEITWDLEGKNPISHVVNINGNGQATIGASVVSTDATAPAEKILPSLGTMVELADYDPDTPSWYEAENIRSITLAMWKSNTAYNNSGTGKYTKRLAGNFDASLTFAVHTDDFSKLSASLDTPDRGKSMGARVYITDTLYWLIEWMKLRNLSDLTCDREGTVMIGMTLNWELSGFLTIGTTTPTATTGKIQTPEAVPITVWP